jgi:hypothetical protein
VGRLPPIVVALLVPLLEEQYFLASLGAGVSRSKTARAVGVAALLSGQVSALEGPELGSAPSSPSNMPGSVRIPSSIGESGASSWSSPVHKININIRLAFNNIVWCECNTVLIFNAEDKSENIKLLYRVP